MTRINPGKAVFWLLTAPFLVFSLNINLYAQTPTAERIVFSAFKDGQWDIFAISPAGNDLRQLTDDGYEDTDPAFSPDGRRLAYASRRNENWDIYILDLLTGDEIRLTDHPHYDAAPAWHPEGDEVAFESYRTGDLDIWLVDVVPNSVPLNVTADSAAGEFDPAWDARGEKLYFASWRGDNTGLWVLDLELDIVEQLTTDLASDSQPTWDPVGQRLAFTRNTLGDEDIWLKEADEALSQYSWLGSVRQPVFSPDGTSIAAIYRERRGMRLIRLDEGDPIPDYLTGNTLLQGAISWHPEAITAGESVASLGSPDPSPLYEETLLPSSSPYGEPYDLVRLNDLQTSGDPWLADTVDDSYRALRDRVRREVGYDFLGEVSETLRPISFNTEASQYSSWHKSGRAVDTLFDWPGGRMEIVRENIGGETYWRIFLRCQDQSGRCGRPMTENAWDYSARARTVIAPEQGGVEKPNLYGYYVDFTTQAEIYGWERISSYDDEDFSWTWHFKAFEYWHYQKKLRDYNGVSNWYQAMLQVYPKFEVEDLFTWPKMRAAGEDPYLIVLKGVPPPPEAQRWWQYIVNGKR